jgi:hypothetical protein
MVDFFLGRTSSANSNKEQAPAPIQRVVQELLRIARNTKLDRRGTDSERRRQDPDLIVELSQGRKRDKRVRLDRRESYGYLRADANHTQKDRRQRQLDRRKLVNDGIYLTLSSVGDRRSSRDRRR